MYYSERHYIESETQNYYTSKGNMANQIKYSK